MVHRADDGERILDDEIKLDQQAVTNAVAAAYHGSAQQPPAAPSATAPSASAVSASAGSIAELSQQQLCALSYKELREREKELCAALLATRSRMRELCSGALLDADETEGHEEQEGQEGGGRGEVEVEVEVVEEEEDDGGVNGPVPESWRWYVLRAFLAGHLERTAMVMHVFESRGHLTSKNPRDLVVGVARKETKQKQPLWLLEDAESATYVLTAEGESLRGTGGYEDLEHEERWAPREGSMRCDILTALHARCTSREDVVNYTWEHGLANTRGSEDYAVWRADVLTVIGKEKKQRSVLWVQDGEAISLTPIGRKVGGGGDKSQVEEGKEEAGAEGEEVLEEEPREEEVAAEEGEGEGGRGEEDGGVMVMDAPSPQASGRPMVGLGVVESIDEPLEGVVALQVGYLGRVIVDWISGPSKGRYRGVLTGWKTELGRKGGVENIYIVTYDDTQRCEHSIRDDGRRAWVEAKVSEEESLLAWERCPLSCLISKGRLTTPARGEYCTHAPRCNHTELRSYVGREKKCPVALCSAPLERTAGIVVDINLQQQLALLPQGTECFWYGPRGQVTVDAPEASPERDALRKRAQVKVELS